MPCHKVDIQSSRKNSKKNLHQNWHPTKKTNITFHPLKKVNILPTKLTPPDPDPFFQWPPQAKPWTCSAIYFGVISGISPILKCNPIHTYQYHPAWGGYSPFQPKPTRPWGPHRWGFDLGRLWCLALQHMPPTTSKARSSWWANRPSEELMVGKRRGGAVDGWLNHGLLKTKRWVFFVAC